MRCCDVRGTVYGVFFLCVLYSAAVGVMSDPVSSPRASLSEMLF